MSGDELGARAAEVLLRGMDPGSRESGLRLDKNGIWYHESTPVTHRRLARALFRWLDREPGCDRFVLRPTPDFWAWVDVEDAPYQASLTEITESGELRLLLSGDLEDLFRGPSIFVDESNAWYIPVRGGRFEARLSRGAMSALAEHMQPDDTSAEGVILLLPGGRRISFARRPRRRRRVTPRGAIPPEGEGP